MKKNTLLLLSLCLMMLSCQEETVPSITLNQTEIAVSNGESFQVIHFESNVSWTAKSSESWCSIYPASGDASTKDITVTAASNDTYDDRSCTITIVAGEASKKLTVNQNGSLGILVTQDKYELSNEATTIEVGVKANVEYDVIISDDWISQITTRGLSSTKLNFDIAKNSSYDSRSGSITIKQKEGSLSSTIKVFQSQKDAIILSNRTANLSSDSQTLEVELKTNIDFEVIIPDAAKSWISYLGTRALRTEILSLNIAVNEEYDARTTEIYVKNKATSLQDTLTVNQSAKLGLLVTQDIYDLNNEAAIIEVEVKTNVEYDVIISDDWITKVTTRGLPSTKLNFNIAKNSSYDKREGSITLKQKNGTLTSTITIYQSQKDAIILSNRTANLSSDSQILKVELRTNVDFEVIIPEAAKNWVFYTPTRALRTEILSLSIAQNNENDTRTTKIYIRNKTTGLQDILTINQISSIPKTYIDTRNINTYVGASNFLIDKLLEAKPTAKFIFITHFTEDGAEGNRHLKTLIDTQLKVAEYWGVQSVNLAETMGAVKKTGVKNTLVEFATDELHPATSQDLWSVNKIAQQIASEINGIYGDWTGKKIAWYGTSIAAGANLYTPESQYPLVIANLLGCTTINYSKSGAKIRRGKTNGTPVSTSFLDTSISSWNYQKSIINLIGTANEPDLFVFDFGINDWYIDSTDFQNVGN